MTREDFCKFLESRGWTQDRFGHYKKTMTMRSTAAGVEIVVSVLHRMKILKTCARLERKPIDPKSDLDWILLSREYYTNVKKTVEGTHYLFGNKRLKC